MRWRLLAVSIASIALGGCLTVAPGVTASPSPAPLVPGTPGPVPVPTVGRAGSCQLHGVLPDPVCTPGATNPDVTQATIRTTICVRGWTARIRPPQSFTGPLKTRQMLAYGERHVPAQVGDLRESEVEEDHLVPLSLGGAPWDVRNLWPEPGATPNAKDHVESSALADVCAGRVSLADAQRRMASDWTSYRARGQSVMPDGGAPELDVSQ